MPWNEHASSSSKPLVVGVWVTSEVNQYLSCFVDQHLGCLVDQHMGYFVVMVSLGALQLSNFLIFWVVAGFQRIFLNVGSVLIFKSPLISHLFLCSCDTPCGIPLLFDTQCLLASCWGLSRPSWVAPRAWLSFTPRVPQKYPQLFLHCHILYQFSFLI